MVLTLPMALDLSAPLTYAADQTKLDCNPDTAVESPCPFQQVDASGLARVITSLPLAADRVLFRQSARTVLVADAEISSPVQIATSSGFLALSIDGNLELTQGTGEHLQTLAFTQGTAADPVYIPVPAFVEQVRQQAVRTSASTDDVFSQKLQGAVEATIDVSVDDSEDALDGTESTELTLTGTVAEPRRRHPGRTTSPSSPRLRPRPTCSRRSTSSRTTRRRCSAACARPSRAPAATSPR